MMSSKIVDMSSNIRRQVNEELTATPFPFSIQLVETTDVFQCSQLLVFVRYVDADTITEELQFCEPFLETTEAINIHEVVVRFFADPNFDWKKNLVNLCTDRAPAMLGNTNSFVALVKKEAPQVIVTLCFLHRHALALKTVSSSEGNLV